MNLYYELNENQKQKNEKVDYDKLNQFASVFFEDLQEYQSLDFLYL